MNTKLSNTNDIKAAFDQIFNGFTEEEIIESDARLIMFRFLSIIEEKCEALGINRKQLAEKVGTSASYITQLYRGDKLVNMLLLAKLQKVLDLEFEIIEKKPYEEIVIDYAPLSDENGFWIYRKFQKPEYDTNSQIPDLDDNQYAKAG
jgi:transcriptional regulator with XRE-family HTH domain